MPCLGLFIGFSQPGKFLPVSSGVKKRRFPSLPQGGEDCLYSFTGLRSFSSLPFERRLPGNPFFYGTSVSGLFHELPVRQQMGVSQGSGSGPFVLFADKGKPHEMASSSILFRIPGSCDGRPKPRHDASFDPTGLLDFPFRRHSGEPGHGRRPQEAGR